MEIRVTGYSKGVEKFLQKLDLIDIRKLNQERQQEAGHIIQQEAKKTVPVGKNVKATKYTSGRRAGGLRKSITLKHLPQHSIITPEASYALYVHEGTRPHLIQTRIKKILTDGHSFFGKRVRHPGTKKNRFMDLASANKGAQVRKLYLTKVTKFISAVM